VQKNAPFTFALNGKKESCHSEPVIFSVRKKTNGQDDKKFVKLSMFGQIECFG